MIIKRDFYLNQLIHSKHNGMIKVITGIRRSGKSYLLFELFNDYLLNNNINEDHIIKFAFDSQDYLDLINEDLLDINIRKRKVDPKKFNDYIKSKILDKDMHYILLDEIQLLDNFEAVLNGYLRKDNLDVYVTGSNAKFLSKDVITEFRGRGWQIHINPLSFKEFKQVFNGSNDDAYNEYAVYGGLPKLFEFQTEADKVKYLNNIFEETYLKDIIDRNKIVNVTELGELLDFLASSIGSLTNPTKLSNTFDSVKHVKIHPDTIRRYIEYFADSFLISTPKRYDIMGKGYINSPLKYYFSDMGLRNARLNFRELEQPRLMENIVYNELVMRGYNVDVGVVELYEQNGKGKSVLKKTEVDFVCNQADKRYYIQVAYTIDNDEKIAQEQKSLLHINDAFKKIIIVKDSIKPHYNNYGVYIIGLYDFLLNENILNF
ncbi:MAG: ATP-binding protein [Acholeplasmatales bacterium]|nr:ATP-binding protein [Acholeplasmatales bacterium]